MSDSDIRVTWDEEVRFLVRDVSALDAERRAERVRMLLAEAGYPDAFVRAGQHGVAVRTNPEPTDPPEAVVQRAFDLAGQLRDTQ